MTDDFEFDEKPDWKTKIREKLTGFIQIGPKDDTMPGDNTLTQLVRQKFASATHNIGQTLQQKLPNLKQPASWSQSIASGVQSRNFDFYAMVIAVLMTTYIMADLSALMLDKYLPQTTPPPSVRSFESALRARPLGDYQVIFSRNLFNSKGLIPGDSEPVIDDSAPVKTSLPFNLIGTVILKNELRSIATIEDRSASLVFPVRIDDEIPGKAKILSIESYKVTFFNPSTNRREFVDLPEDLETNNPRITLGKSTKVSGGSKIEKIGANQFNLPRGEVDAALSDLNQVLTQARALPHSENGVPSGWKLIQIVPGSIHEKLGLQNNDIIQGVNGEPITDPAKAFEMLTLLKTSSRLELSIKRDGKATSNTYEIR